MNQPTQTTKITYTPSESGLWMPTLCLATPEQIVGALFDNHYHVHDDGVHVYRSILPGGRVVHAVRMPDGRVWDANYRAFRCLYGGARELCEGAGVIYTTFTN